MTPADRAQKLLRVKRRLQGDYAIWLCGMIVSTWPSKTDAQLRASLIASKIAAEIRKACKMAVREDRRKR